MKFLSWHKIVTTPSSVRFILNLWPPFLFSGIRVKKIADDFRSVRVELCSSFLNKNYVGTHFGGSLYAMSDPFFMLMVMNNLDSKYYVWDQKSKIEFVSPGRGRVYLEASITEDDILDIIKNTEKGNKYIKTFSAQVLSLDNSLVCNIEKSVYIRLKPDFRSKNSSSK